MSPSPIHISVSSNEVARPRFQKIKAAIEADERFTLAPMGGYQEPPFDLKFQWVRECPQCHGKPLSEELYRGSDPEYFGTMQRPLCGTCLASPGIVQKALHVEIRDFTGDNQSDYVNSIREGHLWEQVTAARERGEPFIIAVLGDDHDIQEAVRKAAGHFEKGEKGKMVGFDFEKFVQYSHIVDGFEANCEGAHIRILKLGYNQYPRLLLRARKILQGGDLTGFIPAPADGERQAVGLSILLGKGFGPKKSASILEKFRLCLRPKLSDNYLTDCEGIGEKLALQLAHSENIMVPCQNVCKPKAVRKAKA